MTQRPSKRTPFLQTTWYPYAMAGSIVVAIFVLLTHLPAVWFAITRLLGFFSPVIYGCVIAYIVNPLAMLFDRKFLRGIKKDSTRWLCSSVLAFVLLVGFVLLALMHIVPQLIDSITSFFAALDSFAASLAQSPVASSGLGSIIDLTSLTSLGESLMQNLGSFAQENFDSILGAGITAGKSLVGIGIAIILSFYLLVEKHKLKAGVLRLMRACMSPEFYDSVMVFLRRSDVICNRYIVFNLLDSLIIGIICAVVMTVAGMPYVGLVSFAVGVTNLIPTFGPVIGGVIGAFILFTVSPVYALCFLVFVILLQFFDGYILKPRLFGSSLGVSGLWILIAVIVGGSMFGIAGMLLAIPVMAIIDFSYHDYFLPWLERRRAIKDAAEGQESAEPETHPNA